MGALDPGLADLARYVDASDRETRRHLDVVAETLRANIGAVAHDLEALSARTDRSHHAIREELVKIDSRLLGFQLRLPALERS